MFTTFLNFIKSILPSSRTGKDPLVCQMKNGGPCAYQPIPLGDLKLTHLMRRKFYQYRKNKALIESPCYDKKLIVLVPYRHREKQLEKFPSMLKDFLKKQSIENEIWVIEQADDGKPFNKGQLVNIGALLTQERGNYFCLHDIDMLPEISDYGYINHPTLLANSISQFDEAPNHETYFGGVILFPKEDFFSINGFSNQYWHWGAEDDDLLIRCLLKGLTPVAYKEGRYGSLIHKKSVTQTPDGTYHDDKKTLQKLNERYLKNKKRYKKMRRGMLDPQKDGLNTLQYKILDQKDLENYIKVTVALNSSPNTD